jgi:RNA polymerase sigma-70 factor, ECF subfamily
MKSTNDARAIDQTHTASAENSIRLATFDQYRSLLFSIAYRMLGSVADAEDMLQETFLRWQQSGEETVRSPRAFLVTIIGSYTARRVRRAMAA